MATPPSSALRKPVTASGILALTHSPLLYKSTATSASKRMALQVTGKASRGCHLSADPQTHVSLFCMEVTSVDMIGQKTGGVDGAVFFQMSSRERYAKTMSVERIWANILIAVN